jgi:ArsR family transcriptional regulator
VGEITTGLAETQANVSQHLSRLRDRGVVVDTRRGRFVFYRLAELPAACNGILSAVTH